MLAGAQAGRRHDAAAKIKNARGSTSMHKSSNRALTIALLASAALVPASAAIADEAASASPLATPSAATSPNVPMQPIGTSSRAAPADAASQNQVQEIVVTAQKRSESLQNVPVSVQVLSGQTIAAENYNSLQSVTQNLPDVHIVNTGGPGNSLVIRGIGSGAGNPAFDQSVATFVDDIYHGRSHLIAATFLDIDRVEVLKGPQSTFFGNNAIAGALNIVTKKPDDHFDGYARALYGSYGQFALEGAAGGPITDTLGVRLAGTFNGQNGWIHNVVTGDDAPRDRNIAGRATFVWKPNSDFDATFKVEENSNKITGATNDTPFQWTNCPAPAPLANTSINKFCANAIASKGAVPLGLHNNEDATLPGQFAKLNTNEDVLTLNYHHWGQTFTSVTGYSSYQFSAQRDLADTGAYLQTANTPEKYHQFTQELRITSPTRQTIEYMLGAYYQSDNIDELVDGHAPYVNPTLIKLNPAIASYLPLAYDIGFKQRETVESVFGSASWNVSDNFKLNAGIRGSRVHKDFDGSLLYGTSSQIYGGFVALPPSLANVPAALLGVPGNYPLSRTDTDWMPSAGFQYHPVRDAMLYFTYSNGFKAGGYNGILALAGTPGSSFAFGPEHVNSYEFGVKSKLLDNRAIVNVSVFRSDYSGLQVNSLVQVSAINQSIEVRNAASSRSQGVELETQLVISKHFRLSADITYLDAKYVSFPNASPTFVENLNKIKSQNLSGQPLDFASKWSGSVRAEYSVDLPHDYKLTATINPFFETKYFNSNGTDDPVTLINGHMRLDGMISLAASAGWNLDLIGKNLTNAVIVVAQNNTLGAKEEPRNVAVQLRYRW